MNLRWALFLAGLAVLAPGASSGEDRTMKPKAASAFTEEDRERGWYYGQKKDLRPGTPKDWVHIRGGTRGGKWAPPDRKSAIVPPVPGWRRRMGPFQEHLAKVSEGWTGQRLLDHAGKPDSVSPAEEEGAQEWYYRWDEGGGDGMYCYFVFTVKDGAVKTVRSGSGCRMTH